MKETISIYADFNNADVLGRVRLTTNGTLADLEKYGLELTPNLEIIIDDGDGLSTVGIVRFSEDENIWVAEIDWESFG